MISVFLLTTNGV